MLFIHIGAEKTGSSSIQHFMARQEAELREAGIIYPTFGRGGGRKHKLLQKELRRNQNSIGEHLAALLELCHQYPDRKIVISDEALYFIPSEKVDYLSDVLRGIPVHISAYFREYAGYITALYNQETKLGQNVAEFDVYFERTMALPGQATRFLRWGEAFGWQNITIRTFGRSTLVNGDAVDDFLQQLGTSIAALGSQRSQDLNLSPGWRTTELIRSVLASVTELSGSQRRRGVPAAIEEACRQAVAATIPKDDTAEYLTSEQRERCDEATAHDVSELNARLLPPGMSAPVLTPKPGRSFLPSIEHVPTSLVVAAMARAVMLLGDVTKLEVSRSVNRTPKRSFAPATESRKEVEARAPRRNRVQLPLRASPGSRGRY